MATRHDTPDLFTGGLDQAIETQLKLLHRHDIFFSNHGRPFQPRLNLGMNLRAEALEMACDPALPRHRSHA
jgi:hypothetical protein